MGGPDRDTAFAIEEEAADVTGQAEGAALGEVDVSAHEGLGKDDQPAADVGVGRANLDRSFDTKLEEAVMLVSTEGRKPSAVIRM